VSKNKIAKWAELAAFPNVVQHSTGYLQATDHHLKGKWKRDMFANENPLVIELGCGKGEYTTGLSFMFPEKNFIGVDIKGARMWRGARTALEQKLDNAAFQILIRDQRIPENGSPARGSLTNTGSS